MIDMVEIPVRIVNETDTGWCVTQEPYSRYGVWVPKSAMNIPDVNEIRPFHMALVERRMAISKGLKDRMAP